MDYYSYICTMKYTKTKIEGVFIIEPKVFPDARGYFFEAFKNEEFEQNVGHVDFVQENESKSSYGVLRGLHYQKGEYSQAKLVRVIKGRVLDVAVDLRKGSATFGEHISVELSVDNVYAPAQEASIRFDDPQLAINWPIDADKMLLSDKDLRAVSFSAAELFE